MRTFKQYQAGAKLRNIGLSLLWFLHGLVIIVTAVGLIVYYIVYQEGVKKSILACNANAEVGFISVLSFIFVLVFMLVIVIVYFTNIGEIFTIWVDRNKINIEKPYVFTAYNRGFFSWCLSKGYLVFDTGTDHLVHYRRFPVIDIPRDIRDYQLNLTYTYRSSQGYFFSQLERVIDEAWLYHKDEFENEQSTAESTDN